MATQFVSEQELAETYGPDTGWETVTQYRGAVQLREQNPDMARAEIARRVGRPASAVRGWLAEDKTPRVVTAVRTARDRGWLDIEPESEEFRALNQLVAWVFSGGGIQSETPVPYFSADDPLMLSLLSHLLRWVQIDYRCRDPENPDYHLEIIPTEGGAVLGRVLSILGAPRGVKAEHESLTLPPYLEIIDREHQRDFARIYLLNRGKDPEKTGTDGTYVHQSPASIDYSREIGELFEALTTGTATVGSEDRVWISAAAVRDLAGDQEPRRSALATAALHGTFTPPTDRAVASTFRRTDTPRGYRYHQCYQAAHERDGVREVARDLGLPASTIQGWRRGSKPSVTNALERADTYGWLTPPVESETSLALTALVTWLLARGTLRETYYPVFIANQPAQRERFETIASTLDLSYSVRHADAEDMPTELRPSDAGAALGRVLYALGVPRQGEPQSTALLPPYVYHHPRHAQQVADIWWLHFASDPNSDSDPDREAVLSVPPRLGDQFPTVLAAILSERLSWSLTWDTGHRIVVTYRPDESAV